MSTLRLATSLLFSLFIVASSCAASLGDLSNADATAGLKAAMQKGSSAAVAKLGVKDGFLKNSKVRIPLPPVLKKARPALKMVGKEKQLDDLEVSMNRAAESAVPLAKPLFINAVKSMSVDDAKKILKGGDTAVTEFFRKKTSAKLKVQFLPIVKGVTDRSNLSAKYNSAVSQAASFGITKKSKTVEEHVTEKALDGLFLMIAEEEKKIRKDPVGSGSKIISTVFGALK
ncbi:MAG: DUF4197 domain-containing protein [Oxalobacter sp.]|nr:MAG: DUF4197 domain-containing protein [Oxalobacter sp.]